jgi:RimJ/RimL family protein N-acetyltransferase
VDAKAFKDAVDTSLGHLRPWMPWARTEPKSLTEKIDLLRSWRGEFDRDTNFVYGIFPKDLGQVLGCVGLHPRVGPEGLEIGYWLRTSALKQGYATEAVATLTRAAFKVCGVDRVEIHVDPSNTASLQVPTRLGFTEEARLRRRLELDPPGYPLRDEVIFSLFAGDFESSVANTTSQEFVIYDGAGRKLDPETGYPPEDDSSI